MFMQDTPLDLLKPGDPQLGIICYSAYYMCSLPRNYLHVNTVWKFSRAQKYNSPCEKCAKVLLAWYTVFRFKKCKTNLRGHIVTYIHQMGRNWEKGVENMEADMFDVIIE
jgi:hypothetical protein